MSPRGNRRSVTMGAAIVASLVLALMPASGVSASPDEFRTTEYRYTSEPGDYIGQGLSEVFSEPSQIAISGKADFVQATVGDAGGWNLWFRAPEGQLLQPGVYRHAERASFATGRSPGLDVFGNGRGCNEVFGRFAVNQIRNDADGNVTALDVRFVQRCEAADAPALRGWFRYRVAPLSYAFTSDPGDYMGGGVTRRYEGATTVFRSYQLFGGARIDVSGERDDWSVILMPPDGTTLVDGEYLDARRFPDATHPGLDVTGDGRGCNEVAGSFEILAIRFHANGAVKRLHATFEQHCDGAAAALRGEIHFHG